MLETSFPQVDALLRDGVWVRGVCRRVRLLLGSAYAARSNVPGHKGASATQLFLGCKSTRSPRDGQAVLDEAYSTLQYVGIDLHLREETHVFDRMMTDGATRTVGEAGTTEHHCSVERSPLLHKGTYRIQWQARCTGLEALQQRPLPPGIAHWHGHSRAVFLVPLHQPIRSLKYTSIRLIWGGSPPGPGSLFLAGRSQLSAVTAPFQGPITI